MTKRIIVQINEAYYTEKSHFLNRLNQYCIAFQTNKGFFDTLYKGISKPTDFDEIIIGDIINPSDDVVVYEIIVNKKTEEELRSEYVNIIQNHIDSNVLKYIVIRMLLEVKDLTD